MPNWTHLIRSVAAEDLRIQLRQLTDTEKDLGIESLNNHDIKAYLIDGNLFDGEVTAHSMTVKQVARD